ncbi:MAG: hypothetical protein QOF78_3880, partial [Phycisphaerales bacterium]|nr:hypothetical protein [Phycisphaerales bacterium]
CRPAAESVDNAVTMSTAAITPWKNEPTVKKTAVRPVTPAICTRRSGQIARAAVLFVLLAVVAPARAQDQPKVTGATVQFDNGAEQKLVPAPDPTPPTPPVDDGQWKHPILGVNLESVRDYDRQFMFIDVIKTSRRWGTPEKPFDSKGPIGDDGWPAGDFGTCMLTETRNVNGVYKFSATGRCDITTPGSPAKVVNLLHDAARNRTTADVVIAAPQDKRITLNLACRGTDGGLKDIKLLRPGYSSDEQIFTSEFLAVIKPFDALRFMDYLRTNNSQIVKWDERCKPGEPQYGSAKGAPYELAIELGNKMDKDIWLNVPALADDDFVRQLGALIREKLKPGRHAYVEYSNEVWNGQFKQFRQNEDLAKAEVAAGETTLNDNGADSNVHYWGRKRIAKRSVEIRKLLGDDAGAGGGRIRVVLPSQIAYAPPGTMLKMQLDYVAKYHGPPSQFFFAIAGAPYFSPGRDETDLTGKTWYTQRGDLTVDGICDRLLARTHVGGNENVKAFTALAKQHGLKHFAYEGGLDLQQYPNNVDVKIASQYDLRTGQAVEDYLDKFYASGGDAMFYFTLSSKYSKSGYWGLTEDVRDVLTPKYLAATRVAAKLRGQAPAPAPAPAP